MVKWIAKDLLVTTIRYQTVDDMVEAIGLPKEKLCLYCWTGQCPDAALPEGKVPAKKAIPIEEIPVPRKPKAAARRPANP